MNAWEQVFGHYFLKSIADKHGISSSLVAQGGPFFINIKK